MQNIRMKLTGTFGCVLMIVCLAGCGKKEEVQIPEFNTVDLTKVVSSAGYNDAVSDAYYSEIIPYYYIDGKMISDNLDYEYIDGYMYILSKVNDGSNNELYLSRTKHTSSVIDSFKLNIPDSELYIPEQIEKAMEVDDYSSEGDDLDCYQCSVSYWSMDISDDGFIYGAVRYDYNYRAIMTDAYYYAYDYVVCKWNKEGSIIWNVQLADNVSEDNISIYNSYVANGNSAYITANGSGYTARVFDNAGNICLDKNLPIDSIIVNLDYVFELDGNAVAFYKDDNSVQRLVYLNDDLVSCGDDINIPGYVAKNGFLSIDKGINSDFIFSDRNGVFKFNIDDSSVVTIMDYVNSDFNGYYVDCLCSADDNGFYGSYLEFDTYNQNFAFFAMANVIDDGRAIAVLGTYYTPIDIRRQVFNYNAGNNVYRIVVKDYSYNSTVDAPDLGTELLVKDIEIGTGPDFLAVNPGCINTYSLANDGLLLPWNYLVNNDSQFDGYKYYTNAMDAYAINGLDYILVYDYCYRTFIGNAGILSNAGSWNIKDFNKIINKYPSSSSALYMYVSKEDYIGKLIEYNAGEYIDYENATCSYNCSDFIDLIEYGASLPDVADKGSDIYSYQMDSYRNGSILLHEEKVVGIDDIWQDAYRYFDGNACIIGLPSINKSAALIKYVDTPIMIIANRNVGGAWDFTKSFYSREYQYSIKNAIPVNIDAFESWAGKFDYSEITTLGVTEYVPNSYYYMGEEHDIPVMNKTDVDVFKGVIMAADRPVFEDEKVKKIIEEEIIECYNNKQSSKKAAENIDSRVKAYLSE